MAILSASYTYDALSLSGVVPNHVSCAGGTELTIHGTSFSSGTVLLIAGASVTGVVIDSDTQMHVAAPPHTVGVVDIGVTSYTSGVANAVQNLSATAGNGQVSLSWSAPSNAADGVLTGYRVCTAGVGIVATTGTTAVITNLVSGTLYRFVVFGVGPNGGGVTASVTATTLGSAPQYVAYGNQFSAVDNSDFTRHWFIVDSGGTPYRDSLSATLLPGVAGGVMQTGQPAPPTYPYYGTTTLIIKTTTMPAFTNGAVEADVRAGPNTASYPGIMIRSGQEPLTNGATAPNETFIQMRIEGPGNINIYEKRSGGAGNYFQIGSNYAPGVVIGNYYKLKLEVSGTNVNGYVDGVLRITGTTTLSNSGSAGFALGYAGNGYVSGSTPAMWDNMRVWSY